MHTGDEAPQATRLFLIMLAGVLFSLIPAAPLLSRHGHPLLGASIYFFFSPVCHQSPHRSFFLDGLPWAVCHRCAGIYLGLLAGCLLPARWWASSLPVEVRRRWALAATLPLALDAMLPYTGLWSNTPASRFVTGILFGAMLMTLLIPGSIEFFRALRERPRGCAQPTEIQGGYL